MMRVRWVKRNCQSDESYSSWWEVLSEAHSLEEVLLQKKKNIGN